MLIKRKHMESMRLLQVDHESGRFYKDVVDMDDHSGSNDNGALKAQITKVLGIESPPSFAPQQRGTRPSNSLSIPDAQTEGNK